MILYKPRAPDRVVFLQTEQLLRSWWKSYVEEVLQVGNVWVLDYAPSNEVLVKHPLHKAIHVPFPNVLPIHRRSVRGRPIQIGFCGSRSDRRELFLRRVHERTGIEVFSSYGFDRERDDNESKWNLEMV